MTEQEQGSPTPRPEAREVSEVRRMAAFVLEQERRGVIAPEHTEEIFTALLSVLRRHGYLGPGAEALDELAAEQGAAVRGVVRHAAHLMKQKLLSLYPALAEGLTL